MNLAKSVFKNVSYLLIARTAFRFLTAFALIYAARYLGAERYGMFETATAWANMFLALNDVGMSTLIVREAARNPKSTAVYFGNTLFVETVLSIVMFALIIMCGFLFGYNQTTITLMAILGASNLIFEFRKVMRGIFRVNMSMRLLAITEIINGAAFFGVTMLIIFFVSNPDSGLLGIAHASLWTDLICVLILFFATLRLVRPQFNMRLVWPMIKQSYLFAVYNMFFMLYFQIDQIIISIIRGAADVGIYSAAAKLVTVLLFIPMMVFQVTMPILYKYSKENMDKYKRINHVIWRYLAAFGIPAGAGIWLLGSQIIQVVYGSEYAASGVILQIFGWFLAIRFIGISQGNALATADKQGVRAVIQIICVAINIVLGIVLVRAYGPIGAAIATLCTEVCITIAVLITSARHLQESVWHNLKALLPIIGATAGMIVLLVVTQPYLSLLPLVLLGMMSYAVLLWLFRFFREYDKQILKQIIQRDK